MEWYLNSLNIEGSPVAESHAAKYPDVRYEPFVAEFLAEFVAEFLAGHVRWDPEVWARLFPRRRRKVRGVGHQTSRRRHPLAHRYPEPPQKGLVVRGDCVGDLASAMRAEGMRFGVYYSGGLDWTFGGLPITDFGSMISAIPQSDDYLADADAHWRELIDRYQPSVLWNDIDYPSKADLGALHDYYFERVPDGVMNDRFT